MEGERTPGCVRSIIRRAEASTSADDLIQKPTRLLLMLGVPESNYFWLLLTKAHAWMRVTPYSASSWFMPAGYKGIGTSKPVGCGQEQSG